MDENLTKLFNRGQSTIHKSDYLDSLTSNIILKDILLYRPEQIAKFKHPMTNKEKLSLLYGLYHNYCWRQFDRLYNPKVSFIHQKRIPYLIRIAEDIPKDLLLGLLMMIFSL
jgi:hypothetical protein